MNWWMIAKDPKDTLPPMPVYPRIELQDIPPASVALFYNGQTLTEKEARVKGFPFKLPPYHATMVLEDGQHLTQGARGKIEALANEMRSTRRIDIIVYNFLTKPDRAQLCDDARKMKGKIYDIGGFLHFGFKFIMPWKFAFFCSELCAYIFKQRRFTISFREPSETAPFHLWEYAHIYEPSMTCEFRTLHIGQDYPKDI